MTSEKIRLLDGATGSMLIKMGMKESDCTERFILENPEIFKKLQADYIKAGSDIILAPTFGANSVSLARHGFKESEADDVCRRLVAISQDVRKECGAEYGRRDIKIGADLSPTGLLMKPYGSTEPEEIFNIYKAQIESVIDAGADFIMIETMISAAEAVTALRAARSVSSDIPVFVSMTVGESGHTMNGDSLDAVLITLAQYGVDAFGCNCSIGPDVIYNALKPASGIAKKLGIPLIAKPNAGLPVTNGEVSEYPLTPDELADWAEKFVRIGVAYLGGCCGTTPAHIKALADKCRTIPADAIFASEAAECEIDLERVVSTVRTYAETDDNADFVKINDSDDLYDAMDEADGVLYLELEAGQGDIVIAEDAFITMPICLRGDENEIEKVAAATSRKVK